MFRKPFYLWGVGSKGEDRCEGARVDEVDVRDEGRDADAHGVGERNLRSCDARGGGDEDRCRDDLDKGAEQDRDEGAGHYDQARAREAGEDRDEEAADGVDRARGGPTRYLTRARGLRTMQPPPRERLVAFLLTRTAVT